MINKIQLTSYANLILVKLSTQAIGYQFELFEKFNIYT